jgi:murein DD-endopeptidase MepM/ murein hydrolase activator NlpD
MGVTLFLFIALVVFLVDYVLMSGVRGKYKDLRQVTDVQKQTLALYKDQINSLETKISDIEEYQKKINTIAGLEESIPMVGEPGVGGPITNQDSFSSSSQAIDLNRLESLNKKAGGIESNLFSLTHHFEDQNLELANTPSISPVLGYWSSSFGMRDDPFTGKRQFHYGVDIATQQGNQIVATADGVVLSTKYGKTGGNTVTIHHPITGYKTIYCHLSKYLVKPGQKVKRGDPIGLVGRTGRAKGPHVHYEVHLNNRRLNPWNYILDR